MTHFTFSICSTQSSQLETYAQLYNRSMMHLHGCDFMVEDLDEWSDLLPSIAIECRNQHDELCGIALLQTPKMAGSIQTKLILSILAVDPEMQGHRLGRMLVEQSFRLARSSRLKGLWGCVREDSPSIEFYRHLGFSFSPEPTHISPEDVPMYSFSSGLRVVDPTAPVASLHLATLSSHGVTLEDFLRPGC